MKTEKPREIAARILQRWEEQKGCLEDLLNQALDQASLSPPDRGLVHELTCGVVRWRDTLDWLIERKTAGRSQNPCLRRLLRLGLYQMFWLDRIPNHAAVNESVALARQFGLAAKTGFINAILRGYAREQDETRGLLQHLKTSQPALGGSHPAWLWERWQKRWGTERVTQLMVWNNTPPVVYARVNQLKTDAGQLAARWVQEGVSYAGRSWDWTDEGLVFELKDHPPLAGLESFKQGLFYVQDPSTILAVRVLDPQPGETVLDLCAAPGGKTTLIAQFMANRGRLVAQDNYAARLDLLRENCARLGVTGAEISRAPEAILPELSCPFDRILVDAPCSNTGVMRRRVDLRWRIRQKEIERLQSIQLDLIRRAVAQLKPGGVLVYSTCSLEPEENQDVGKQILAEHPDLRLETERELFPVHDGVDGAYVARWRRGGSTGSGMHG